MLSGLNAKCRLVKVSANSNGGESRNDESLHIFEITVFEMSWMALLSSSGKVWLFFGRLHDRRKRKIIDSMGVLTIGGNIWRLSVGESKMLAGFKSLQCLNEFTINGAKAKTINCLPVNLLLHVQSSAGA
jgi:hypothetical protein